MIPLLEEHFSFTTAYSMKECRKALTSLESGQFNVKLLELDDKRSEMFCKLERYYGSDSKRGAYLESQVHLRELSEGVAVNGRAKISLLQLVFLTYGFIMSLFLAYAFRAILIGSLIWLLGVIASAGGIRSIFANRRRFIEEIYDLLEIE